MGLFDKIKGPVFLKETHSFQEQLEKLECLHKEAEGDLAEKIEEDINRIKAGAFGENTIYYELANSHIPMLVLQDLYLEYNGLTAQIDYLIITRKHQFVVECKNLYGNIEINSSGDFIRTVKHGQRTVKEGIYSPITQNRRHLELIKEIRGALYTNIIAKSLFEKNFYDNYKSVVVLANPKTVLYDKYAKKELRSQVIRADQLVEYIRKINGNPNEASISEKDMETLGQFFLAQDKPHLIDYTEKYRIELENQKKVNKEIEDKTNNVVDDKVPCCPKCGASMVKRKATRGQNAGQEFYGCSRYPHCRGILKI